MTDALVPHLLRSVEGASAADEAAFWEYAAVLLRQLGMSACVLLLAGTLLWWPFDPLVLSDPAEIAGFSALRTRALVVVSLTFAALALPRPRANLTRAVGVVGYAAILGVFGYSLGRIGPSALPWFADAFIGLVPMSMIPMRLGARALATAAVGAALAVSFFAAASGNLAAPGAASQISFLVFAVLFSTATGEVMTRVTRRAWFERVALDRANASLAELTETLSERVAERTERLQALTRHLDQVQETERRRIAHDLHDDLGQQLTAMRYTVARIEQRLAEAPESAPELLGDLSALLHGTSASIRGTVSRLRPRVLDDLGLVPALEWLCEDIEQRSGVPCSFERLGESPPRRLDPGLELVLFRVVQEATTNALKHAEPSAVHVTLRDDGRVVRVTVEDDGRGFDPDAETEGFGLLGIRERLRDRGGLLEIASGPQRGTRISTVVPTPALPAPDQPPVREPRERSMP